MQRHFHRSISFLDEFLNKICLVGVTILNTIGNDFSRKIVIVIVIVISWKGLVSRENQCKNNSVFKNAVAQIL